MLFQTALLSLIPLAFARPQDYGGYAPPPSPATTSSSSSAAAAPSGASLATSQIIVQVAPGGSFVFQPSDIQAPVGTLVTFSFPGNIPHSVTESNFGAPCTPLQNGFDSGLVGSQETFSINVTDASSPIYFFCKFPGHCGGGMVGTINAPSGSANGSFSSFQAAAVAIGANEATVPDNGPVTGGVGAIATAGPMTGTPSVAPAPTSASSSSSPSPTSGGSNGAAQLSINAGLGLMALAAGAVLL